MNNNGRYLYFLDFVRFIAAFMVMGYHFFVHYRSSLSSLNIEPSYFLTLFFNYGHLGVPVFFIISGYVIFQSANGRSWYEFFYLRILRIYPLYIISIVVLLLSIFIFSVPSKLDGYNIQDMLFVNNHLDLLNILKQACLMNGKLWVAQAWSLRIELRFYIDVAIIILLFKNYEKYFLYIASLVCCLAVIRLSILPQQPWIILFVLGSMLSYLNNRFNKLNLLLFIITLIISSYLMYMRYVDLDLYHSYPLNARYTVVFVVLFTCLSIIFFHRKPLYDNFFKTKVFKYCGGISYPMYILHEKPGVFLIYYLNKYNIAFNTAIFLTMIIITLISFLLYKYFDVPIQKYGKRTYYKFQNKFKRD